MTKILLFVHKKNALPYSTTPIRYCDGAIAEIAPNPGMAKLDRRQCAVCGTPTRPPFVVPVAEGAPDLDFRPGEPARSTLANWVQTCRNCVAAAPDLSALPLSAAEVVRSENYKWLERHGAHVRPHLRWARLCAAHLRGAAFLQAAWAEDDAGNDDKSVELRLRAIRAWGPPEAAVDRMRKIDVLRRVGAFDRARAHAEILLGSDPDPTSAAILRFQLARIDAGDVERHIMSSALPALARQPHVARIAEPQRKPGLLARLFKLA